MKIKLADSKLVALGVVFVCVVLYMTITSISLIDNSTAHFIGDMQSEDTVTKFQNDITLLLDTADALSGDKEILEALQYANDFGYNDELGEVMLSSIFNFTHLRLHLYILQLPHSPCRPYLKG